MNIVIGDKVNVNGLVGTITKIGNEKIIGASIPYIILDKKRINIVDIININKEN